MTHAYDPLLTEAEAAERLALCRRTVRKLRQRGELEFILIGGSIRYSVSDLVRFIDERRTRCVSIKSPVLRIGGSTSPSTVTDIASARKARSAARSGMRTKLPIE